MVPMLKSLSIPIPPIAVGALQMTTPGLSESGPGWLATLLLGVWVTLWFLREIGKLPGKAEPPAVPFGGFDDEDRKRLEALYHLLAFRDDKEGVERFLKYMQEARASHATMQSIDARLAELARAIERGHGP